MRYLENNYLESIVNVTFFYRVVPEGVDLVLDCQCGEESNRGYNLLAPMGRYILFGASNVVTGETRSIFSAARSVRFLFLSSLSITNNFFLVAPSG